MTRPRLDPFIGALLVAGVLATSACSKKEEAKDEGVAPPPIESSKAGVCDSGGGAVKDSVAGAFVPRSAGEYCVDPNGDTRAYGKDAAGTVDKVCTEQFDGECEVYKRYGLDRVVVLRYIDGKGSPGSVSVTLSRFEKSEGAYGFYTKRVIADSDPLDTAPAELDAGAAGALGTGVAYVWRGQYVAELSYINELESPDQLKASAGKVLPPIAAALGAKLPGPPELLPSARALPEPGRLKHGIRFDAEDLMGISGAGPGAVGYYKSGAKRFRVFAVARDEEASAKDVFGTLLKQTGAKVIKQMPFAALGMETREEAEGPAAEWVVGQQGKLVIGIGDEPFALMGSPEEAKQASLGKDEKLKRLMSSLKAGAGASE